MARFGETLEQEIKARLRDPAALRTRLAELGAVCETPLTLETNDIFDRPERSLRANGLLLRVRRFGASASLTLKDRPTVDRGLRSRVEEETAVADSVALERILAGLGFVRVFRYQKRREIWRLAPVEVAIDETPMGWFLEVEGDGEEVRAAATRLGVEDADIVEVSYGRLWNDWRAHHPGAPADMLLP